VLAEEAPAGCARQIVGRRQLAVLLQRDAQYRLELDDAPRRADARVELEVADPAPDAFVGPARIPASRSGASSTSARKTMKGTRGALRPQFAYQLEAVGEHHRAKLGRKPAQGFAVVRDRLALQNVRRDTPLHVSRSGAS